MADKSLADGYSFAGAKALNPDGDLVGPATRKRKKQKKKRFWRTLAKQNLQLVVPPIFLSIYFLLLKSWKFRLEAPAEVFNRYVKEGERKPCIFSFWHSDDLALLGFCSFRDLGILISHSNDGELMTKVLKMLQFKVIRGSSSSGGTKGLMGMILYIKEGGQVAVAVDGPRGPLHEVKPGVVELTRRTQEPIIPVRAFAEDAWFIPKSWNKTFLPKPFTKIRIVFGEPIWAPGEAHNLDVRQQQSEAHRQLIKYKLQTIADEVGKNSISENEAKVA